jgi:hypothetical protein
MLQVYFLDSDNPKNNPSSQNLEKLKPLKHLEEFVEHEMVPSQSLFSLKRRIQHRKICFLHTIIQFGHNATIYFSLL